MTTAELKKAVLHLSPKERAEFAQLLLESLDTLPEQELRELWLDEAARRAEEIDLGKVQMISGEELERQVQDLFRDVDGVVEVLAVAAQRRRPGYWVSRLQGLQRA
jgi:putative addiction module component (TIGR02574 family)